jgi:hypothetical protein
MTTLLRSQSFRPRGSLLEKSDITPQLVEATNKIEPLRDKPDVVKRVMRRYASKVQACLFGKTQCLLPEIDMSPEALKTYDDELGVLAWKPEGYEYPYLLPIRANEPPTQALARYLDGLEKNPATADLAKRFRMAASGSFYTPDKKTMEPVAIALDSHPGENAKQMHQILEPMRQRGVGRAYLLPPGYSLTLNESEANQFRSSLAEDADLMFADQSAASSSSAQGTDLLEKEKILAIKDYLNHSKGFYVGVGYGAKAGEVAAGVSTPTTSTNAPLDSSSFGIEMKPVGDSKNSLTQDLFRENAAWSVRAQPGAVPLSKADLSKQVRVIGQRIDNDESEIVEFLDENGKSKGLGINFPLEENNRQTKNNVLETAFERGQQGRVDRLDSEGIHFLPKGVGSSNCEKLWRKVTDW